MRRGTALLVVLLSLFGAGQARAQSLVADLSSHLVAITTGFTGADLVLFGAVEQPGDLVVVVRGPPAETVVRRKERMLGLWLNRSAIVFREVPGFYELATSRPIEEIASPETLARYGIGLEYLKLVPSKARPPAELAEYRAALIGAKQEARLYPTEIGKTQSLGPRLFRTNVYFPANVPTGTYSVDVFLFRNGQVVSAQTTPLVVSRVGFSAEIYSFSLNHAATYAVGAIALAVAAGWTAGAIFRKG